MATELAKAYVQIIPSARGIGEGIQKEIDGSGVGQKAGSSIASGIGSALKGVGGTVAASLGAAMAGVGAVAKEAFSSFANYQQLTGGIETLFGTGGQSMMDMVEAAKAAGESTKGVSISIWNCRTRRILSCRTHRTHGKLRDSMSMITWRPCRALRLL